MEIYFHPHISSESSLPESEAHHCIHVMRHVVGDMIHITDGCGNLYQCCLISVSKKKTDVVIVQHVMHQDINHRIHIAVVPVKSMDRLEFMIEKLTELGVTEITFIRTTRCERDKINMEKLMMRAVAAVKQSRNLFIPVLHPLIKLDSFIKQTEVSRKYVAALSQDKPSSLSDISVTQESTCILIGPEGDFTEDEMKQILNHGYEAVSLGSRVLRTETAAIYAAVLLGINN